MVLPALFRLHHLNCLFRTGSRILSGVGPRFLLFVLGTSLFLAGPAFCDSPDSQKEPEAEFQTNPQTDPQADSRLSLEEARQYLVSLINKDRQSQGLNPVVLDDIASKAGQVHTDEMAQAGYLSHWGLDGKKPDERYSEAGGNDMVMENAYLMGGIADANRQDNPPRLSLSKTQSFSKSDLEKIESVLFNEKPPMDGHRKNILAPEHNRVGIALSVSGKIDEGRLTCTEEFINSYGEYGALPALLKLGQSLDVKGKLKEGIHLFGIDLMREDLPKPMRIEDLNKTYSYGGPGERVASYWPNVAVKVDNEGASELFAVAIDLQKSWQKGLYYIWVWAKREGVDKKPFLISSRAIIVN
jgi:Cysteine-rich secretory protein family